MDGESLNSGNKENSSDRGQVHVKAAVDKVLEKMSEMEDTSDRGSISVIELVSKCTMDIDTVENDSEQEVKVESDFLTPNLEDVIEREEVVSDIGENITEEVCAPTEDFVFKVPAIPARFREGKTKQPPGGPASSSPSFRKRKLSGALLSVSRGQIGVSVVKLKKLSSGPQPRSWMRLLHDLPPYMKERLRNRRIRN